MKVRSRVTLEFVSLLKSQAEVDDSVQVSTKQFSVKSINLV